MKLPQWSLSPASTNHPREGPNRVALTFNMPRTSIRPARTCVSADVTFMSPELKEWADQLFGETKTQDVDSLGEVDELCDPDYSVTLLRLTAVFENASTVLKPYTDQSLNQ